MRKLVLIVICCAGLFYAPLPLVAQRGGEQAPLIPVVDMPTNSGGATVPSDPPLEVEPDAVPELVPPQEVRAPGDSGGGPADPAPPDPEPVPEATPAPTPGPAPPAAEPAQTQEPTDEEPVDVPETPETPEEPEEPEADEPDEEEFEEEFDDVPEPGDPDAPEVTPRATDTGPQLPRTGADLPALVLSALSLLMSGTALRALCSTRA